jgi:uncharacterized membrane protein (DUF373 family)
MIKFVTSVVQIITDVICLMLEIYIYKRIFFNIWNNFQELFHEK